MIKFKENEVVCKVRSKVTMNIDIRNRTVNIIMQLPAKTWTIKFIIAPLSDIQFPMFYIKYLTMHNVHMHAGAIRQLLYGCV